MKEYKEGITKQISNDLKEEVTPRAKEIALEIIKTKEAQPTIYKIVGKRVE